MGRQAYLAKIAFVRQPNPVLVAIRCLQHVQCSHVTNLNHRDGRHSSQLSMSRNQKNTYSLEPLGLTSHCLNGITKLRLTTTFNSTTSAVTLSTHALMHMARGSEMPRTMSSHQLEW